MNTPGSKWVWLCFAAAVLAGICIFSYNGLDMAVAKQIQDLPKCWHEAAKTFSSWGKGELYAVPAGLAGAGLFWFWRRHRARFWFSLFAIVAVAGSGLLNSGLKFLFGRARPPRVWPSDASYDYGFHLFHGTTAAWQSFPSGHNISAAAAATVLWFVLPRWARPACVIYVASMMAARMLANAHFFSDVLAGAFLGVVFTLALRDLMRRHKLF